MAKYIITTVSTFVLKYAIEAECEEHACDEWVMLTDPGCCEIKQTHVSEDIADVREATDQDIINEADEYMKDYVLRRVREVKYD